MYAATTLERSATDGGDQQTIGRKGRKSFDEKFPGTSCGLTSEHAFLRFLGNALAREVEERGRTCVRAEYMHTVHAWSLRIEACMNFE